MRKRNRCPLLTAEENRAVGHAVSAAVSRGWVPPTVEVDDLYQAAHIALWRTRKGRAGLPEFSAAYQQALWAVVEELRAQGGRKGFSRRMLNLMTFPLPDDADDWLGVSGDDPESALIAAQAVAFLRKRLTARELETLEAALRFDEQAEAAAAVGVSASRVSQVLRRARVLLAQALGLRESDRAVRACGLRLRST